MFEKLKKKKPQVEICERNCDLKDQPILYVNRKEEGYTSWKRVKCDNCPHEN